MTHHTYKIIDMESEDHPEGRFGTEERAMQFMGEEGLHKDRYEIVEVNYGADAVDQLIKVMEK